MSGFVIAHRLKCVAASVLTMSIAGLAQAQDTPPQTEETNAQTEDEVIAYGTQILGQHDGMSAFFNGDFETAEIEFEREFKSLRRFESARENAAIDAALSADRAADVGLASDASTSAVNGRGGGIGASATSTLASNAGVTSNFLKRRATGRSILTDGKVTYDDFGFTRYMSGLSEIKLGKFDEAYDSMKTALRYTPDNYDARLRFGLLNLQRRDYEKAADQLEKLEDMRQSCRKRQCENLDTITEAALALANEITGALSAQ